MIQKPFDEGSPLKRHVHQRLIQDKAYYCRLAGIQPHWLWQPLASHTGTKELKWVVRYPHLSNNGTAGLILCGDPNDANTRMPAICGALVRNFVDARIRTVDEVLDRKESDMPDREASCLMFPTFCSNAGDVPDWKRTAFWELLSDRERNGRLTVLFAVSMEAVRLIWGVTLYDVLNGTAYPKVVV